LAFVLLACRSPAPTVTTDSRYVDEPMLAGLGVRAFGADEASLLEAPPLVRVTDIHNFGSYLAVADAGAGVVLLLGEDNVAMFGGKGDGPGEFRGDLWLSSHADTLFVFDVGAQRLTEMPPDGMAVTRPFELAGDRRVLRAWILGPGDIAMLSSASPGLEASIGVGSHRPPWRLSFVSNGEALSDANPSLEFDGDRILLFGVGEGRVARTTPPYYATTSVATLGNGVVISPGDEFLVESVAPARTDTLLWGPIWRTSLTSEGVERERAFAVASRGGGANVEAAVGAAFESADFPALTPAVARLMVEGDSAVWAERYAPPSAQGTEWLRKANSGSLTRFRFPSEFTPMAATSSSVFGILENPLGEPQVAYFQTGNAP
jgi:hypothetical protein